MKGQLASRYEDDQGGYSDLKVLESVAGFYLGTTYTFNADSEFPGLQEPGSRESVEYFPTHENAETALTNGEWTQRDNP